MKPSFAEAVASAREIELAVARWLMERGWRVLPVYDYSGLSNDKAPKLQAFSSTDSLVTPDLLIIRAGITRWVEVKYKSSADFTRLTQRLETGISLRLWQHYEAVARESGAAVFLCFAHRAENVVTINSWRELSDIGPRLSRGPDRGGSVFWPIASLRVVGAFSDIAAPST